MKLQADQRPLIHLVEGEKHQEELVKPLELQGEKLILQDVVVSHPVQEYGKPLQVMYLRVQPRPLTLVLEPQDMELVRNV